MYLKLALLLSALSVASCREDRPDLNKLRIVAGNEVDASLYPVVSLQKLDSQGQMFSYCTGVLLSPTHVLTAAHCSSESTQSPAVPVDAASRTVVAYDSHPERSDAKRLAVAQIHLEPGFDPLLMQRNAQGLIVPGEAHDLAIWTLAEKAPHGPLLPILTTEAVERYFVDHANVILMGFGKLSAWDSPWIEHTLHMAETPYFATVEMTEIQKILENGRPRKKTTKHMIPGKSDTEFYAGGRNLPDTCKGDSGGPVFVKSADNRLLLAGITSRGAVGCDEGGVYTLVPAFLPWINALTSMH